MQQFSRGFFISIVLIAAIAVIMVFTTDMEYVGGQTQGMEDFSSGWTYEDGSRADLSALEVDREKPIVLSHSLKGVENGDMFCFRSKNIWFDVVIDGESIYQFEPDTFRLYGRSYGSFIHSIRIKSGDGKDTLQLFAKPVYHDNTGRFKDVRLDRSGEYIRWQIFSHFGSFIICLLTIVVGWFLFLTGAIFSKAQAERTQALALGLLAILTGIWVGVENLILQILTRNSGACHFLNYLALIFLPAAANYLVAYRTGFPRSRSVQTINGLVIVNAVFQVVSTLAGWKDYHELLRLTHIVILLTVANAVYLFICSFRARTKASREYLMMFFAFGILAGSGVVDIILYNQKKSYGFSFTFGVLIFVIYLGYYEVRELMKMVEQNLRASEFHRMAHHDGLTGLENRLAFNEYEEYLRKEAEGEYMILQFDVNNLKKVNDEFGHAEGDRHIIGAAQCIYGAFEEMGHIFRTGGDEFIGIISGKKLHEQYEAAREQFQRNIEEYNREEAPPVRLEIAFGSAEYICSRHNLEEAELAADQMMYTNKKKLKKASARRA